MNRIALILLGVRERSEGGGRGEGFLFLNPMKLPSVYTLFFKKKTKIVRLEVNGPRLELTGGGSRVLGTLMAHLSPKRPLAPKPSMLETCIWQKVFLVFSVKMEPPTSFAIHALKKRGV